jgi:hypothetical protein
VQAEVLQEGADPSFEVVADGPDVAEVESGGIVEIP